MSQDQTEVAGEESGVSDAFDDRIREGVVVITEDGSAALRATVDAAASAKATTPGMLSFVRLAFDLEIPDAERGRVSGLFSSTGAAVTPDQRQLTATLAVLTLIERFSRPLGRRTMQGLLPDAAAASAVIVLADQGRAPVHPDVLGFATRWRAMAAEHLRRGGGWGGPPELAKPAETPEGAPAPEPGPADIEALRAYAGELNQWLRQTSSSARLLALEEQQGLLWWLASSERSPSATAAVLGACEELLGLSAYSLGPPAAGELLSRRLTGYATEEVSIADLSQLAARTVPEEIADLCPLLSGGRPSHVMTAGVLDAARWLYDELQLTRLAGPAEGQ
jgi:hypothetical protein